MYAVYSGDIPHGKGVLHGSKWTIDHRDLRQGYLHAAKCDSDNSIPSYEEEITYYQNVYSSAVCGIRITVISILLPQEDCEMGTGIVRRVGIKEDFLSSINHLTKPRVGKKKKRVQRKMTVTPFVKATCATATMIMLNLVLSQSAPTAPSTLEMQHRAFDTFTGLRQTKYYVSTFLFCNRTKNLSLFAARYEVLVITIMYVLWS